MKRVNLIYRHPLYQKKYNALQKAEEHRKFCNHTLEHFLDVARLMYIYSVEQELSISKEVIYAAAFMHDIGRIDQIEKGIPHEWRERPCVTESCPTAVLQKKKSA